MDRSEYGIIAEIARHPLRPLASLLKVGGVYLQDIGLYDAAGAKAHRIELN